MSMKINHPHYKKKRNNNPKYIKKKTLTLTSHSRSHDNFNKRKKVHEGRKGKEYACGYSKEVVNFLVEAVGERAEFERHRQKKPQKTKTKTIFLRATLHILMQRHAVKKHMKAAQERLRKTETPRQKKKKVA